MTKDDILTALRMIAHGRPGHPAIEQLAEEMAEVFAPKANSYTPAHSLGVTTAYNADGEPATLTVQPIKRGPGRPKKAD